MSEHTPKLGPYCLGRTVVQKTHPSIGPFYQTYVNHGEGPNHGNCVAVAYGVNATEEESRALGALIAAAPDLLAACEKVVAAHEKVMTRLAARGWDVDDLEYPNIQALRAAVAKAKGGAS